MADKVEFEYDGKPAPSGEADSGAKDVKVKAAFMRNGAETPAGTWRWMHAEAGGTAVDIPANSANHTGAQTATLTIKTVTEKDAGTYTAVATPPGGGGDVTGTFELKVKAAVPAGGGQSGTTTEVAPTWRPKFAIPVLVVALIAVVLVATLTSLLDPDLGLKKTAYESLAPAGKLAARVIGPMFLVGVVLVIVGLAMAVVEWQGRFADPKEKTNRGNATDAVSGSIKALGELKGSGLVLISGLVAIGAAAWIASSATAPPPAAPTVNVTAGTGE